MEGSVTSGSGESHSDEIPQVEVDQRAGCEGSSTQRDPVDDYDEGTSQHQATSLGPPNDREPEQGHLTSSSTPEELAEHPEINCTDAEDCVAHVDEAMSNASISAEITDRKDVHSKDSEENGFVTASEDFASPGDDAVAMTSSEDIACPGDDTVAMTSSEDIAIPVTDDAVAMSSSELPFPLLSLPDELLLKIFDYLKARVLLLELSLVCKALYRVISRNVEWKVRYRRRFRGAATVLPVVDDEFDWKLACVEREEVQHRWAGREARMEHFSLSMGHIAAIDCVHLMNNAELCFTGSRDRTYQLWDLRKLDANNPESSVKAARSKDVKAHKGWVWDMTSLDNNLCTASWDCWLKIWDVNNDLQLVNKFKGRSAFLSVVYQRDAVIAGAYDKSIYIFDPRMVEGALIDQLKHHTKPVLSVVADDEYIISGSEDKTIVIYDRRANAVLRSLKVRSFCMGMSYAHGQLWTGHRDGNVNLINPTHGAFDIVATYDLGHRGKITDIINTMGALFTCSTDTTIRISEPCYSLEAIRNANAQNGDIGEPCYNPETIRKIGTHQKDIAALDLQCGVLASACSDLTTGIWRPMTDDDD